MWEPCMAWIGKKRRVKKNYCCWSVLMFWQRTQPTHVYTHKHIQRRAHDVCISTQNSWIKIDAQDENIFSSFRNIVHFTSTEHFIESTRRKFSNISCTGLLSENFFAARSHFALDNNMNSLVTGHLWTVWIVRECVQISRYFFFLFSFCALKFPSQVNFAKEEILSKLDFFLALWMVYVLLLKYALLS